MRDKRFDFSKFINCDKEQKRFKELLTFKTPARILSVKDEVGGQGKSWLLEQFRYLCQTGKQQTPVTPVSLIALDQLPDHSPLALIKLIAGQLSELDFNNYKKLVKAVNFGNLSLLSSVFNTESSSYTDVQEIRQGVVVADHIGQMNVSGNLPTLTQAQLSTASEEIVEGFFKDLRGNCAERPAVVMLDAYEKSTPEIKSWIDNYLLKRHFFGQARSECRWLLVIAGQAVPSFEERWPEETHKALVVGIDGLSRWTRENIEQCMRARGFRNPSPDYVDIFYRMIEIGIAPQLVVQSIDSALEMRRRAA